MEVLTRSQAGCIRVYMSTGVLSDGVVGGWLFFLRTGWEVRRCEV